VSMIVIGVIGMVMVMSVVVMMSMVVSFV